MKVKAIKNMIYRGKIYSANEIFEMDEITFAIAKKYGNATEAEENAAETVELPPLQVKKK